MHAFVFAADVALVTIRVVSADKDPWSDLLKLLFCFMYDIIVVTKMIEVI